MYFGHITNLKDKCNFILVPRIYSLKKNEQVCTNFNALYDLVNNLFNIEIINYNINLEEKESELLAFLKMGESLGFSYIKTYKAYKYAVKISDMVRRKKELEQEDLINSSNMKILLAGHPYNLYDSLIGGVITKYLKENNIEIIYSDRINHLLIDDESYKLSTDIHWTYNKEIMASVNYYKDLVDGVILVSSFPCGPDSLANEVISRKVKNIPVITLIFEDINSEVGVITRLESFIDILKNLRRKR